MNGASGAENAFTVDGIVTNSLVNGQSRQNTVFEYLQEVQVKTSGISAEYGGALGGVVSAVTKSGGNTFRGEAHYYFEGSALARRPGQAARARSDDRAHRLLRAGRGAARTRPTSSAARSAARSSATASSSTAPTRRATRSGPTPTTSPTAPATSTRNIWTQQAFGKLTFASRRVNASWSTLWTPTDASGTLIAYDGATPERASTARMSGAGGEHRARLRDQPGQHERHGRLDADQRLVPQLHAAAIFHDRYTDTGMSDGHARTPTATRRRRSTPSSRRRCRARRGFVNTPRAQITEFDTTKRTTFNVDYNHSFSGGGYHTLKGGYGFQHTVNDINSFYPGGYVNIFWGSAFTFGGQTGHAAPTATTRSTIAASPTRPATTSTRSTSRTSGRWATALTLNLGLRTENEKVPTFRPDYLENAFEFGFGDKLAPRLGAAYDVSGDGTREGVRQLGPLLRLDQVRAAARIVRRRDVVHLLPRPEHARSRQPQPEQHAGQRTSGSDPGQLPRPPRAVVRRRHRSGHQADEAVELQRRQRVSRSAATACSRCTTSTTTCSRRSRTSASSTRRATRATSSATPASGAGRDPVPDRAARRPGSPTPRPKRQYDALELGYNRRFADNWFFSANYTLSRLYGNYAGLASSDEITTPTTGGSVADGAAAGGQHLPPGRQREPRVGPRRAAVGLARQPRRPGPPGDRSSARR